MLLLPVVWAPPAPQPIAMLREPVVLLLRANTPIASLKKPVVLNDSELSPSATFW